MKEVRDVKEVQLLGNIISLLGDGKYEEVVDLAAMRIREIRFAKAQGSRWEKAASQNLMSSSVAVNTSLPDGALGL